MLRRPSVQNSLRRTVSDEAAGALDVLAEPVLDVVAELGLDPDRDAVGGVVSAVVEADVLDGRLADDLNPVAPAAAVEVVEPALPFLEQVGRDEPGERCAVAAVPRGLDLLEQRGGVRLDDVGGERGVVLGGLRGGSGDAPLALGHAPAGVRPGAVAGRPVAAGARGAPGDQ